MNTAPEPFLLLEPDAAPRLEEASPLMLTPEAYRTRLSPALIGLGILGFGIPTLWAAWCVSVFFDRWAALGWR
jgi:hypothetical protein